jgi:O-antigen biosynthesis protein
VTRRLLRFFLGREWVVRALKGLYTTFFEEISRIRNSNPDIREVMPMPVRRSELAEPRINLLLPGLSERHVFGGIATALEFLKGFEGTAPHFRIIVTDESRLAENEHRRFPGWDFVTLGDADRGGRRIVPAEDREQASLAVAEGDRFIATSWWTAHIAREILRQQRDLFAASAPSFIYLIQDFEPGFYPWSARYVLAEQTYQDSSTYVPVFNYGSAQGPFGTVGPGSD